MSRSIKLFPFFTGCAGWTIAKEHAALFPNTGTHLERYAQLFSMVEINVTFYRLPKISTFEKWAASVPAHFRFAVKMPRTITHFTRFKDTNLLETFLDHIAHIGEKLGPVLIQLPPSFAYDKARVVPFFEYLRKVYSGSLVCEPRHPTWFVPTVEDIFKKFKIARVAADPVVVAKADHPGGWEGLAYYRLHGSPKMYYSAYSEEYLNELELRISEQLETAPVWCIFDNTAGGEAVANALKMQTALQTN